MDLNRSGPIVLWPKGPGRGCRRRWFVMLFDDWATNKRVYLGFSCLISDKSSSPSNLCFVITTFVILVFATNTNIYAHTWSFLHFIVVILFFFQISRRGDWFDMLTFEVLLIGSPKDSKDFYLFFWSCSNREFSVRSCCLPRPAAAIQIFLWEIFFFLFCRFYKLQKKLEEMWIPLYTVGLWHTLNT